MKRTAGGQPVWLLIALGLPSVVLFLGAFAYPIGALLLESFQSKSGFTLEHYQRILTRPLYVITLWRTLRVGALTTLICLLIGFPFAIWLTRLDGLVRNLAIACVLLPLWTSVLVRSYAWVVLLQPNGVINRALMALGLTEQPLPLLYNEGAVLAAMVHVLLPFMVLPIYTALRTIPPNLNRAAQSLGASSAAEFRTVVFPLARSGMMAGSVLVFVQAIGYFITPALLGGPRTLMLSTLINQQITSVLNWSFGGALGAVLLLTTALVLVLFNRALTTSRRARIAS